jgi:hypothetical protein
MQWPGYQVLSNFRQVLLKKDELNWSRRTEAHEHAATERHKAARESPLLMKDWMRIPYDQDTSQRVGRQVEYYSERIRADLPRLDWFRASS